MNKEVQIDKGREKDTLTLMVKEVYDKVNEYNEKNPENQINMIVISRDTKGGASFMIGEVGILVNQFYKDMGKHQCFREFFKRL